MSYVSCDKDNPILVRGDGRGVWIVQQLFGYKLCVGRIGSSIFDDEW